MDAGLREPHRPVPRGSGLTMREPTAGDLDRRLQFRRSTLTDDDFGQSETWADHGAPVYASYAPVRDSEKWAAGQIEATSMARFVVRWSAFTADIGAKDRLTMDEREWSIVGVKEGPGRRQWIEVTAVARSD